MTEVKIMPTRAGNGYKAVVNDEWLYTSNKEFWKMVKGSAHAVTFRDKDACGFEDAVQNPQEAQQEISEDKAKEVSALDFDGRDPVIIGENVFVDGNIVEFNSKYVNDLHIDVSDVIYLEEDGLADDEDYPYNLRVRDKEDKDTVHVYIVSKFAAQTIADEISNNAARQNMKLTEENTSKVLQALPLNGGN